MSENELRERVEKLEKVVEEQQETIERLKNENSSSKSNSEGEKEQEVSRREFLKKAGIGVAGLSAAALIPSAAGKVTVSDTGITKDGNSFWHAGNLIKSDYLQVDGSNSMAADLDMGDFSILNPDQIETGGGGTDTINFYDSANAQNLVKINEGGNVEISNGNLKIATNSFIQDTAGVNRYGLDDAYTRIYDDNGNLRISMSDGVSSILYADSLTPWQIYDNEGSFTALEYATAASAPGTLKLNNSNLNVNDNYIDDVARIYNSDSTGNIQFRGKTSGATYLQINNGGPVEVLNTTLDVSGNFIRTSHGVKASDGFMDIRTDGSGTGAVGFYDTANSITRFKVSEGGPVEILSSNLQMNQNEAKQLVLDKRTADPSGAVNGQVWYRSDLD